MLVLLAHLVSLEVRETMVDPVRKVIMVTQDQRAILGHLDFQVSKEVLVGRVQLVHLDPKALVALQVLRDHQDLLDLMGA